MTEATAIGELAMELEARVARVERLLRQLCETIEKDQQGLAGDWGWPTLLAVVRAAREEIDAPTSPPTSTAP